MAKTTLESLHRQILDRDFIRIASYRPLVRTRGRTPAHTPAELRRQTLLHVDRPIGDDRYPNWPMWFAAAGVQICDVERGPRFTMASMVVQTAIAGQGVALAGSVLVADDIAAGRLAKPFEMRFPVKFAYYVVCPEATLKQPRIVAFREWIQSEAVRSAGRRTAA